MSEEQKPGRVPVVNKVSKGISRREFARRAAIASAVASLAPAQAVAAPSHQPSQPADAAQGTQAPQSSTVSHAPTPATPAQAPNLPKLSPESQAEADARHQAILAQYSSRFSDEQKADLHRLCIVVQPQLDRLRAYNLENAVSPALYLKPLVERENKPAAPPVTPHPTSPKVPAASTDAPPTPKQTTAPKKP